VSGAAEEVSAQHAGILFYHVVECLKTGISTPCALHCGKPLEGKVMRFALAVVVLLVGVVVGQDIGSLHAKARSLLRQKKYEEALAVYEQILKQRPDDVIALYNSACCLSLLGKKEEAVARLRKAVKAGFLDLSHIKRDPDLDPIRETESYKKLIEDFDSLALEAEKRKKERLAARLKGWLCREDKEKRLVLFTDCSEKWADRLMEILRAWYEALTGYYFPNKPKRYIYICVAKDGESYRKNLGGRVGAAGFYNHSTRILNLNLRTGTGTLTHEFTHALHYADMEARQQRHPVWIIEGFGTMFEQCTIQDGKPVGLVNWRLPIIQKAIRSGTHWHLAEFIRNSPRCFAKNTSLAYAEARYIFFWLQEKGLLKKFYEEYTKNYDKDKTGIMAFEKVVGKSADEAEKEWRDFVLSLKWKTHRGVKLGIYPEETDAGVKIAKVVSDSPADKAGLKAGDIIVEADGKPIKGLADLRRALSSKKKGDSMELTIKRGAETLKVTVRFK